MAYESSKPKKRSSSVLHLKYRNKTSNEKIYHCGASSKDGGRKVNTITLTDDTSVYNNLIMQLLKNTPLVLK